MTQFDASQQVFQQQQAERQNFQQQIQQIPQAQQQPIPKKALILGLISDALAAGSGSGSSNVLGQLKARTERQFAIDSQKMKLQFDILNTQHGERLAAFDDFFELQQEKRAGKREGRAAAQEKDRVETLDFQKSRRPDITKLDKQAVESGDLAIQETQDRLEFNRITKDARVKERVNSAKTSAINLEIAQKELAELDANAPSKAVKAKQKKLRELKLNNDIKGEEVVNSIAEAYLKEGKPKLAADAILNRRFQVTELKGATEQEQFLNFAQSHEIGGPAMLKAGGFKGLDESVREQVVEDFLNEQDLAKGLENDGQSGVLYGVRKGILGFSYSNDNVADGGAEYKEGAFFVKKETAEEGYRQTIEKLASDTIKVKKGTKIPVELDVPVLQMLMSTGEFNPLDPESDTMQIINTYFPWQVNPTGLLTNPPSPQRVVDDVNALLKKRGKSPILTALQAEQDQVSQSNLGLISGTIGETLSPVGEAIGQTRKLTGIGLGIGVGMARSGIGGGLESLLGPSLLSDLIKGSP